jgi:hypothetical protein
LESACANWLTRLIRNAFWFSTVIYVNSSSSWLRYRSCITCILAVHGTDLEVELSEQRGLVWNRGWKECNYAEWSGHRTVRNGMKPP